MSSMYPPSSGPLLQRCIRCGIPLPPNVSMCGNCGTFNTLQQSGGFMGQAPTSSGVYAPVPTATSPGSGQLMGWGQPQFAAPDAFGQAFPSQPLPPANNNFGMPAGFNNPTNMQANLNYGSPSSVSNTFQPGGVNGFMSGEYYQLQQKKRGPKVALIILVGLLLLVVIGAGLVGVLYATNQSQSAPTATPTRTIVTPSVTPLFRDSFANNNTKWYLTSAPGQYSASVGGGSMVLEDDHNRLLWEILPGKSFADFRLDVDATLTRGDTSNGYGVYIRGASSQDSDIGLYYRFELYGDSTYALFKGSTDVNGNTLSSQVVKDTPNASIQKEGQVNHITVIAKGSSMTFMVNGTVVYNYSDTSYKGGLVALFVSNLPNTPPDAQATFANLAIFPVS